MSAAGPSPSVGALPRPLLAIFGATFLVRFAFGITTAIFASYIVGRSSGIGADEVGTVGLVIALSPVGEFSTVLVSGLAADRHGRWGVLVFGLALAAVATAAIGLTRAIWPLAALDLAFGIASGAILAASLALIADSAGADERGLEMGRFDAMNLAGWVVGFAVGLGFLSALPNSALGVVFFASAAVLLAGLAFVRAALGALPPTVRRSPPVIGLLREALTRGEVWLVILPWFVIYMLIGTALAFLGSSAGGAGISPLYLGLAIGAGGLLLVFTQPTYGRLADRFGRIRLLVVGTAGFVTVLAAAALIASYGPAVPLLVLAGIGVLAALAYGPAALASLADVSGSTSRATTMAIYSLAISLGMVVGLLAATGLYASFGTRGLDVFFGGVAAGLALLTAARVLRGPSVPGPLTTPVR